MLQQLVSVTLNLDPFPRILCIIDCRKRNSMVVSTVHFLCLQTKIARAAFTLASIDWSYTGTFPFTNAAKVNELHRLQMIK